MNLYVNRTIFIQYLYSLPPVYPLQMINSKYRISDSDFCYTHIYDYNNFISIYICLVYNFAAAPVQNFMVMGANVQTTKLCECE